MKMKWLLWKDYRVNRLVFIVALVLLVVPHVLAGILFWRGAAGQNTELAKYFVESSTFSVILLQLTLAFMGGNAIAGERIDRSAEFFVYMPVSRGRAVTSKLVVALALIPLIWVPNLVILAFAAGVPPERHLAAMLWRVLGTTAVTGLTFFCVAWFFSSMLESPTFSVCAGLIVPLLVWIGILWTVSLLELDHAPRELNTDTILLWYWGLWLAISAPCFLAGTLYYLRRVEP